MSSQIPGKQLRDDTVTSQQADTTNGAISTVNAGDSAVEGSGSGLARRDHQHAVATGGATSNIEIGDVAAEGVSTNLAREDHVHALPAPAAPVDVDKSAAQAGVSTNVARADHKHDVATGVPVDITDSTNAEGVATTLARSDHQHAHGDRGGGTLHTEATVSVAGFMSAADKVKLDSLVDPNFRDPKDSVRLKSVANVTLSGIQTVDGVLTADGDRVLVDNQTTSSEDGIYIVNSGGPWTRATDFANGSSQAGATIPVEEGASNSDTLWLMTNDQPNDVVGTDDLVFLQIGAGTPRGAGAGLVLNANDLDVVANADGSIVVNANDIQVGVLANDAQHGNLGGGSLHAVATTLVAGFMSAADKTKLDGIEPGAQANDTPNQEILAAQVITGTDTALTDTLNNTPVSNASVVVYMNGVKQQQGAGLDYTIAGNTITWLASSGTACDLDLLDTVSVTYLS